MIGVVRNEKLADGLTSCQRESAPDGIPRFDLYAHGASNRPDGDYRFERFSRQVTEFIEATDFPRPALLLGHSFGAALGDQSARYAAVRGFGGELLVITGDRDAIIPPAHIVRASYCHLTCAAVSRPNTICS